MSQEYLVIQATPKTFKDLDHVKSTQEPPLKRLTTEQLKLQKETNAVD